MSDATSDPQQAGRVLPRYPVYIPSKGRPDPCHTARLLDRKGCPFRIVVEPQELDVYAAKWGADRVLVLPFSNLGQGSIPARNWIKDHATAEGHERHWQLDDNIRATYRRYKAQRVYCETGVALRAVEDFVDRYENVAIAGLQYKMFVADKLLYPPFNVNCHVYSCTLVLNSIPHRWRGRYNEDTDICLQVLADGWCTVLFNAFCVDKLKTMVVKGGNTDDLYQGDGRLVMARSLQRKWPGVVSTVRRFQRPQHRIANAWTKFDTPLKLKPGVDLSKIPPNDYGLKMAELQPVKSKALKRLKEQYEEEQRQRGNGLDPS